MSVELLDDLDDRPETGSRIVVVDAVDEARDPQRLLTDLLVPLARRPGLRETMQNPTFDVSLSSICRS